MAIPTMDSGARRLQHWSLALLAFAQLIYSLDINIVFVALPEIGAGLGFSEQTLQWVVSAYTVCCGGFYFSAVGLPIYWGNVAYLFAHCGSMRFLRLLVV
ncbi:hypothetical protein [Mixta gaviniae]|uniref:hypothetical protein n=1 Tax=Mixta gaviniae TaxID=665914 RepID=UPI001FE612DD|nr:hypothetical protein [Mixta gaviniae]